LDDNWKVVEVPRWLMSTSPSGSIAFFIDQFILLIDIMSVVKKDSIQREIFQIKTFPITGDVP